MWTVHCETNMGFCKYSVVQKILPSPLANIFCKYFVFKKMRQKTQLWWKEWIKLLVPAQIMTSLLKKFSKLYVAKGYLFISALSWSLAALVSNGKESGNWIKMVMIPVYLGNPLSLKTNPSPLLPLIYAGPPGLVKREEEIMHTCHDTGSQCLPPTPCFPSLRIFSSIKLFWTNTDLIFSHTSHFGANLSTETHISCSLSINWSFLIQALPEKWVSFL